MFTYCAAPWPAAAMLAAGFAAMPAIAQTTADDPAAAVPETRYEAAHVQRPPAASATTPDRNWQESNRIVASQPGHDAHAGHAGHDAQAGHGHGHAKPAAKAAPKADPHEHHHHHEGHH